MGSEKDEQTSESDIDLNDLLPVAEAAELLKVSPQTIRRWQTQEGLRQIRFSRRLYTTEQDLKNFARASTLQHQTFDEQTQQSIAELDQLLGEGTK